jgi:hypothetical protein
MPQQTTHAVERKFVLSSKRLSLPVSQHTATLPTSDSRRLMLHTKKIPHEMLNAVLDMDTGKLMEMNHLLFNPKY